MSVATQNWLVLLGLILGRLGFASDAEPDIEGAIKLYNSAPSARATLPIPKPKQAARLREGDVISVREQLDFPQVANVQRVTAYVVVPSERLRVWVATLGSNERHAQRLTEHPVSFDQTGGAVWYQYLALPWPFADRHWLIRTKKNKGLAEETDDLVWEHYWQLATDDLGVVRENLASTRESSGISAEQFAKALYLKVNQGGWVMMPVGTDQTLVSVYATAELGGRLPDGVVARMTQRQLQKSLGDLSRRAEKAEQALASSKPLHTGGGELIRSVNTQVQR